MRLTIYLLLLLSLSLAIYWIVNSEFDDKTVITESPHQGDIEDLPVSENIDKTAPPFKSTIVPGKPDEIVIAERKSKEKLKQLLKDSPRAKKMFSLAEAQKDPVEFYAQVIDQHGKPVEGVRVYVSLGGVYGTKGQTVYTDAEGRFSIQGARATSMGARQMEKPGYEFYLAGISFRSHVRDGGNNRVWSDYTQENPFIYHAWKVGEPTWLLHDDFKTVRLKPVIPYTINFDQRKLKEEGKTKGDLLVTIYRTLGEVGPNDQIDWSVSIEAIDGGLIETDDLFMYEAPESGYQPIWEKQFTQVRSGHSDTRKFYLKTRNGKYFGRVVMDIDPVYSNETAITFHYWINPNSSRNLYYSSSMRIYPQ